MFENQVFSRLVADGRPTGEVVGVSQLLVTVRGLEGAGVNGLVMFENGDRGLVRAIKDQLVQVLMLSVVPPALGTIVTLEQPVLQTGVGDALIGRIVNVLGQPLDGRGPVAASAQADVFADAPAIIERSVLTNQLVSGVSIVDALFPLVLGQRVAILGDNKSGKSTFLRQLTRHQAAAGQIVVYVLIAKRQTDVDSLVFDLQQSGAMKNVVVVVASTFDALSHTYLSPYVGCAIAEHFWKNGKNVITIYDDLSNHAKAYREISLLGEVSPGRDSYPGDMFYAHSSLLERAGKLESGEGTFTALPVVGTPGDDITAYLPTSVMSITDGQIIFDLGSFRKGIRPAVNTGLSVSRVGGRVQNQDWKVLSNTLFRKLADYRQAAEFSQFGTELAPQAQADLSLGRQIYDVFKQLPRDLEELPAQYLMLSAVMAAGGRTSLNVTQLKQKAREAASRYSDGEDNKGLIDELVKASAVQVAA